MNLRSIYERLDSDARRMLAAAAEATASDARVGITVERLLLCALRDRACGAELMQGLDRAGVEAPRVESALAASVAREPKSAEPGTQPAFTETLRALLRSAWAIAIDEYGEERVTPMRFFETIARRGDQWPKLVAALPGFAAVDVASLAGSARCVAGADAPDQRTGDALERFGYDVAKLAREGVMDPVVGMRAPIRSAASILLRKGQNSAVVVGESGVGKTACALGLVGSIARCEEPAPRALHGAPVWALDLAKLRAGAAVRGALEERLEEIARSLDGTDTVLFVDDLHMLIDSGAGGVDALRALCGQRSIRLLATCGWREWRRHIEPDPALARRLAPVRIVEPGDEATVAIVEGLRGGLDDHHAVEVTAEAIRASVRLSRRYIVGRKLPDKAVAALDSACARMRMDAGVGGSGAPRPLVAEDAVAEVIAALTGVPVGAMLSDVGRSAARLETTLRERVVGQDAALRRCATQARAYLAGLSERHRPVGALMLCGPSGTGKTETAHAIADALFGGRLLNVNMSEYQEAHAVSGLKGAPAGYVGYGEGGRLTEGIRRSPYCVVLLDEIEKAHRDVIEMLYQVLDKGSMEDAEGLEADFSNALLILTTNVGDTVVEAAATAETAPGAEQMQATLAQALAGTFAPAFLGRVQIIPYWPLGEQTLGAIAAMRLERLADAYRHSHASTLSFDASLIDWVASRVRSTAQGARFIDGIVARSIRPAVSDYILGAITSGDAVGDVEVAMDAGRILVRDVSPEPLDPDCDVDAESPAGDAQSDSAAADAGPLE